MDEWKEVTAPELQAFIDSYPKPLRKDKPLATLRDKLGDEPVVTFTDASAKWPASLVAKVHLFSSVNRPGFRGEPDRHYIRQR